MTKDLQQQSTCSAGRGPGALGVTTVISEALNSVTIPIRALRAKIQSEFPHYTFLTHRVKKQYKGWLEFLIQPVCGKWQGPKMDCSV